MVSFNPTAEETLPIYLSSNDNLAVIICGFLGWYLQLLTHFFIKVALNDATSTKVYGSLFRRFILIWGIAIVLGDTLDIDRYRSCPRCG